MTNTSNIIVIGGGLAGLMTTIKVADLGHRVSLFSIHPVRRSHSVCAEGVAVCLQRDGGRAGVYGVEGVERVCPIRWEIINATFKANFCGLDSINRFH